LGHDQKKTEQEGGEVKKEKEPAPDWEKILGLIFEVSNQLPSDIGDLTIPQFLIVCSSVTERIQAMELKSSSSGIPTTDDDTEAFDKAVGYFKGRGIKDVGRAVLEVDRSKRGS